MRKPVTFTLLFILITSYNYAQWTPIGPPGGTVRSLAASGSNVIAAVGHCVFISSDNGLSWNQTSSVGISPIQALTISGTTLFAGTSLKGIFRSTNYGQTWIQTSPNNLVINSLASSGTNVFAGTDGNGIYTSSNSGQTWTQISLNNRRVFSFTINGSVVFAGTDIGVYFSSDNGQTWTQTSLNNESVVALNTASSGIFAGTYTGVYFSSNNGQTWVQTSLINNLVKSIISNGATVYAGTWGYGIYSSTDNGITWQETSFDHKIKVNSMLLTGNTFFVGTQIKGVYLSSDNGQNWQRSKMYGAEVLALIDNGANLFAASYDIFVTSNNGQNWEPKGLFAESGNPLSCFAVQDSFMLTASSQGRIYLSSNYGMNWSIAPVNGHNYLAVLIHNSNFFSGSGGGILISTNHGLNWTNAIITAEVRAFAVMGSNIFAGRYDGVLISTDGGFTWNPTTSFNQRVLSLAIKDSSIFAGTVAGLYVSTNSGQVWSLTSLNSIFDVYALAVSGTNLFAGTNNGIYLSVNNGLSWIPKNESLTHLGIRSFLVVGDYIYTGTWESSVWKRQISELVGIENVNNSIPSKFNVSQNYPNPFNPQTKIKFDVPKTSFTKLIVYDLLGREVTTLVNEELKPGTYEADWDASSFSSGVYFYKIISGNFVETKKMVLMK